MNGNGCTTPKYKKLKVYLSGYGPFMGIKHNPSQKLVEDIIRNKTKIVEQNCEIVYDTIYEVSVDYVKQNVQTCHSLIRENLKDPEVLHLLVHFGVNSGSSQINLECRAQNYIKDYLELNCQIHEGQDELWCKMDLEGIANDLNAKHKVSTSMDAGTYLCNYIYFTSSLAFTACECVIPLFIHIPSPEVVSTEECSDFFFDFLESVRQRYL